MNLGIIGATGWLGQALGLGLLEGGLWPAGGLILLNRSGPGPAYTAHQGVTWARDADDLSARADVIVLSVRPEDFPLPGLDARGKLVISFMAGWTMAQLAGALPEARIVRAMPNGGASTRASYTPWIAGDLPEADVALTRRLLSAIGTEDRLANEDQIDYLTALSGSGAAYPALMAQAMLMDARARGLPETVARRAVEAVICDSPALLKGRVETAPALLDAYRSYRGITAAGLDAAEEAGFSRTLAAALKAATAKAKAMGKA